ncbi:MAG: putative bifunctional diguanylate cyclase/phosphodiesterase [Methylobacter sp.]
MSPYININTLEARIARFEHLLSAAPITIYTRKPFNDFGITFISNSVKELLGQEAEAFIFFPDSWLSHVHPEDRHVVLDNFQRILLGEATIIKYRFKMNDGQWKWIRDRAKLLSDTAGHALEIIGGWTDMTELVRTEEALKQSEQKHRFLLEQVNAGVIVQAPDTRVISSNPQAAHLFGLPESRLAGQSAADFKRLLLNEDGTPVAFADIPVNQVIDTHKAVKNRVLGIERNDLGDIVWVMVNAFAELDNNGQISVINTTLIDITQHVKSQEKIHRLAHYDSLTQLPNRVLINERIEQAIHFSYRENKNFALLFLDLDDFKSVNDSLGHHYGDALLRQVAQRLERSLREVDSAGRLGGDEFVIILSGANADGAATAAQKITDTLKEPFDLDGQILSIRTSIGISIYPKDGLDSNTLTRHADIAMYHAKQGGRGHFSFFDVKMNTRLEHRLAMERELRLAIEEEQFLLYYQPQIDLDSERIIGVEALIRWRHPEHGMISPAEFIPISEDCGLINPIGEWVLRQACEDMKTWQAMGFAPLKVSVNLSLRQLQEGTLFNKISNILAQSGIAGNQLELELTESVMMENHAVTLNFMTQCKDLGIHFSIDDFGTGYSSLSYLTKLPLLDKLKIDRSFIQELSKNNDANTIVSAIVNLAKSLRLKVIAEGVETEEQLAYLRNCGCDTVQGFYFSPPVSHEVLIRLLTQEALAA